MKLRELLRSFCAWLFQTTGKLLWSIIKWLFRFIGKLLLLAAWGACEFLAVAFTALSRWLKGVITSKR